MTSGTALPAPPAPPQVVVMGVSGCGKTTVGSGIAAALGAAFVDADDLHPPANVARMRAGIALTDEDRAGWLDAVAAVLAGAGPGGVVVACSALKRAYRDRLRRDAPGLRLVFLHGTPEVLAPRIAQRPGHYMPASLLPSQLATLQPPGPDEAAMGFDVAGLPGAIVADAARWLAEPADRRP